MANESKGMDQVLGSNVSKDYTRVGGLKSDGRTLPVVVPNDLITKGRSTPKNGYNPNSAPLEDQRTGRPISQDR